MRILETQDVPNAVRTAVDEVFEDTLYLVDGYVDVERDGLYAVHIVPMFPVTNCGVMLVQMTDEGATPQRKGQNYPNDGAKIADQASDLFHAAEENIERDTKTNN